jgi:aldehyde:ferredoxin oxidoreductase
MALKRRIAYIDLSTGDIETKPIPLDVRKKFLGGRGLDAYLLYNHTKKAVIRWVRTTPLLSAAAS